MIIYSKQLILLVSCESFFHLEHVRSKGIKSQISRQQQGYFQQESPITFSFPSQELQYVKLKRPVLYILLLNQLPASKLEVASSFLTDCHIFYSQEESIQWTQINDILSDNVIFYNVTSTCATSFITLQFQSISPCTSSGLSNYLFHL